MGAVDRLRDERGSVTAEFVLLLPALLAVLLCAVGAVLLAAHRIGMTAAAAELARLESRGDVSSAQARTAALGPGVSVSRTHPGPLLCIALRSSPVGGILASIETEVRACAAVSAAGTHG